MSNSIIDYVNNQKLRDMVSEGLLHQLSYLLSVKESMENDLSEVDSLIQMTLSEIEEVGIDVS